jgi:tetratricopeptide (TPR) repeat protein
MKVKLNNAKIYYLAIILFLLPAMSTAAISQAYSGTNAHSNAYYARSTDIGYIDSDTAGLSGSQDAAEDISKSGKELYDRARLALFDRQWDRALAALGTLIKKYPDTPYRARALFYKGKCYEEKKMTAEALYNYNAFVEISKNESMVEEATRGIIYLNFLLYKKTDSTKYLKAIEKYIHSNSKVVRYFAGLQLSYVAKKSYAKKAAPVLLDIIEEESDTELVERAKLRLMNIDPSLLKRNSRTENLESKQLAIEVYDKNTKRTTVSLSIPFVFASLALQSLPDDVSAFLKEKGYKVEQIIKAISVSGEIFKVEGDETIFKIWIK